MPDETQNPFQEQSAPVEAVSAPEQAQEALPPADVAQSDVGEATPSAPGSEAPPVDNTHVEAGAEQFVETEVTQAEQAAEEVVHTHESILSGLMTQLEGFAHMAKSEIDAVIIHARGLFEKL